MKVTVEMRNEVFENYLGRLMGQGLLNTPSSQSSGTKIDETRTHSSQNYYRQFFNTIRPTKEKPYWTQMTVGEYNSVFKDRGMRSWLLNQFNTGGLVLVDKTRVFVDWERLRQVNSIPIA